MAKTINTRNVPEMVARGGQAAVDELARQIREGEASMDGMEVRMNMHGIARAVILSLREPTEPMMSSGVRGFQKAYSSEDTLADWRAFWRVAIDKAVEG